MTNSEAIKILDNLKPGDYSNPYEKGEAIVMAISALQAQDSPKPIAESVQNVQNEDLISRKAAIDAMCAACGYDCDKNEFNYNAPQDEQVILCPEHYALTQLPSAQPEPQWIPVSERLPGENEFVLVTFGWFGRKTDPGVNIDEIRDGDWMISEVVTAWMPLPEPYRVERRTDE